MVYLDFSRYKAYLGRTLSVHGTLPGHHPDVDSHLDKPHPPFQTKGPSRPVQVQGLFRQSPSLHRRPFQNHPDADLNLGQAPPSRQMAHLDLSRYKAYLDSDRTLSGQMLIVI